MNKLHLMTAGRAVLMQAEAGDIAGAVGQPPAVMLDLPASEAASPPDAAADAAKAQALAEADRKEAERLMSVYTEITAELRQVVVKSADLERACAVVLLHAAREAGPGNSKAFDRILKDCESTVLKEQKVEKFRDLGEAARSYETYKSHFRQYILTLKATFPTTVKSKNPETGEDVELPADPVAIRKSVSRWYTNRPGKSQTAATAENNAGKGNGSTAGKRSKDEQVPGVETGDEAEDGTPVALAVGMTRADVKVKNPKTGKYETENVSFPTEITAAISRLMRQIGSAIMDGVKPVDIVAALQTAFELIGEADGAEKAKH